MVDNKNDCVGVNVEFSAESLQRVTMLMVARYGKNLLIFEISHQMFVSDCFCQ